MERTGWTIQGANNMSDKEIKRLRKDIRNGKKEMSFLIKLLHEYQLHEYNDWLLENVSETRKLERPRI